MQENIYVRTVGLDSRNFKSIAKDLEEWLVDYNIYPLNNPLRIVAINADSCVVIHEKDIFSFVQKAMSREHCIEKHCTDDCGAVRLQIGSLTFIVETSSSNGSYKNTKFRLTCLNELDLSGEFDDYDSLQARLNEFLKESIEGVLI